MSGSLSISARAVITAGGPIDGAFARAAGCERKALARVRGRALIEIAIDALHECGIFEIAVVGNDDVGALCIPRGARMISEGGSGAENVTRALDAWGEDRALLYLTCDMPYLDAIALRWMLQRLDPSTLAMPLTEHEAYVRRFPDAPEAGIVLNGERVVNGGVFYLPAGAQRAVRGLATTLFDARKAPWKMARVAGAAMLLRFLLGRASIASLERRATALLDLPAAALRGAPPELAFDIDEERDYVYALAHD